jgi:hypothetical protein
MLAKSVPRHRRTMDADESESTRGQSFSQPTSEVMGGPGDSTQHGRQVRLHRNTSRPKGHLRWTFAVPVVVLVIVTLIGGLAGTASSATLTVSTGPGSATIHWKSVKENPESFEPLPQPFTGVVDGITVSGVATMPFTTIVVSPSDPTGSILVEVVNWEGSLGGKPFDVAIFVGYSDQSTTVSPTSIIPKITVLGAWGKELVLGSITPSKAELKSGQGPLRFHGRVGDLRVRGEVSQPTGTRRQRSSSATFFVSR